MKYQFSTKTWQQHTLSSTIIYIHIYIYLYNIHVCNRISYAFLCFSYLSMLSSNLPNMNIRSFPLNLPGLECLGRTAGCSSPMFSGIFFQKRWELRWLIWLKKGNLKEIWKQTNASIKFCFFFVLEVFWWWIKVWHSVTCVFDIYQLVSRCEVVQLERTQFIT